MCTRGSELQLCREICHDIQALDPRKSQSSNEFGILESSQVSAGIPEYYCMALPDPEANMLHEEVLCILLCRLNLQ